MKKWFKKTAAVVLTTTMVIGLGLPAFAAESEYDIMPVVNVDEEMYRAEHGITDMILTDDQLKQISAYVEDEEGNKTPAKVDVTVRDLGEVKTRSGEGGTLYALTAVASTETTSSGSKENDYGQAYGTIYWIDNLGPNNEFKKVTGILSAGNGVKISDRSVLYGVKNSYTKYESKKPSIDYFTYTGSWTGTSFELNISAKFNGEKLILNVYTSMFD